MRPAAAFVFASLVAFAGSAGGRALALPEGLLLDPPADLDLTYQVVPRYDDTEKVIAGWAGEKLQHFTGVTRLPPGWVEPQAYFDGLLRDLRAAGRSVQVLKYGRYAEPGTLRGSYMKFSLRPQGSGDPTLHIAHFLTDGRDAFLAFVTHVGSSSSDRTLAESVRIFSTARIDPASRGQQRAPRRGDQFVGTWTASGQIDDGTGYTSTVQLKEDDTFRAQISVAGRLVFVATGVWAISGRRLLWSYMYSEPALADHLKDDVDEIVSVEDTRLVLLSTRSGRRNVFTRVGR